MGAENCDRWEEVWFVRVRGTLRVRQRYFSTTRSVMGNSDD